MGLFGLSIIKSKNKQNLGCKYKEQSDSICNYLSDIVRSQNNEIFKAVSDQNKVINKFVKQLLSEIKILRDLGSQREDRLVAIESYVKPRNMVFFDKMIELKWIFLIWLGFNTLISLSTLLIVILHILEK
jgi:ABC-type multidrug transport system fused ATPase/permease subunit